MVLERWREVTAFVERLEAMKPEERARALEELRRRDFELYEQVLRYIDDEGPAGALIGSLTDPNDGTLDP